MRFFTGGWLKVWARRRNCPPVSGSSSGKAGGEPGGEWPGDSSSCWRGQNGTGKKDVSTYSTVMNSFILHLDLSMVRLSSMSDHLNWKRIKWSNSFLLFYTGQKREYKQAHAHTARLCNSSHTQVLTVFQCRSQKKKKNVTPLYSPSHRKSGSRLNSPHNTLVHNFASCLGSTTPTSIVF